MPTKHLHATLLLTLLALLWAQGSCNQVAIPLNNFVEVVNIEIPKIVKSQKEELNSCNKKFDEFSKKSVDNLSTVRAILVAFDEFPSKTDNLLDKYEAAKSDAMNNLRQSLSNILQHLATVVEVLQLQIHGKYDAMVSTINRLPPVTQQKNQVDCDTTPHCTTLKTYAKELETHSKQLLRSFEIIKKVIPKFEKSVEEWKGISRKIHQEDDCGWYGKLTSSVCEIDERKKLRSKLKDFLNQLEQVNMKSILRIAATWEIVDIEIRAMNENETMSVVNPIITNLHTIMQSVERILADLNNLHQHLMERLDKEGPKEN